MAPPTLWRGRLSRNTLSGANRRQGSGKGRRRPACGMSAVESVKVSAGLLSALVASSGLFGGNRTMAAADVAAGLAVDAASLAARVGRLGQTSIFDMQYSSPKAKRDDGCDFGVAPPEEDGALACAGGSVLRLSGALLDASESKAVECSASYNGSECILFHEIGLLMPGFFFYDSSTPHGELEAIYLPKRVESASGDSAVADPARVQVNDPAEQTSSRIVRMQRSLEMRYMQRSSRQRTARPPDRPTACVCARPRCCAGASRW